MIGQQVLIRTYSAGVHFGTLAKVSKSHKRVVLNTARRIWSWKGANTLHEISLRGIDKDGSRVSEPVHEIVLTEAIEILPLTAEAQASLAACGWAS